LASRANFHNLYDFLDEMTDNPQLTLEDARFRMSAAELFWVRIISLTAWILTSGTAVWFLTSQSTVFKWTGVILVLFVLDRILNLNHADKPLLELSPRGRANIAEFLTPQAIWILSLARARSSSRGTNFSLELLAGLLKNSKVQEIFVKLGVAAPELKNKLKGAIKRGEPKDTFPEAQDFARLMLAQALQMKREEVGVWDVLAVLGESEDQELIGLLKSSLKPQVLKWGAALVE
jgi:hypothetical protein